MYQTRILNDQEVKEFNQKYNTNYQIVHIQQKNKKYYGIFDCSKKVRMYPKEVMNYFG